MERTTIHRRHAWDLIRFSIEKQFWEARLSRGVIAFIADLFRCLVETKIDDRWLILESIGGQWIFENPISESDGVFFHLRCNEEVILHAISRRFINEIDMDISANSNGCHGSVTTIYREIALPHMLASSQRVESQQLRDF